MGRPRKWDEKKATAEIKRLLDCDVGRQRHLLLLQGKIENAEEIIAQQRRAIEELERKRIVDRTVIDSQNNVIVTQNEELRKHHARATPALAQSPTADEVAVFTLALQIARSARLQARAAVQQQKEA